MSKKPTWVVEKERARRDASRATIWLYGFHAVEAALRNPAREKLRLVATRNALDRLGDAPHDIEVELADARRFPVALGPDAVHQGLALETKPLDWGGLDGCLAAASADRQVILCLDRVSDPHNVGAILRSAAVFGAAAVIAPSRHSAPETGVLAKAASGAVESQPYLRVTNLARTLDELKKRGFTTIGLDGEAAMDIRAAVARPGPLAMVLGAEGPGLRPGVQSACDILAKIDAAGSLASLNVSNAAAVALYAVSTATEI
ncbi:MAG: 23S rRNA (guanosine(2251)-2'-O)-methyltransferase RlmB [Pseudomonadota bacterium]